MTETLDILMIGHCPENPSIMKGGVQAGLYGLSCALLLQPEIGRVVVASLPMVLEPGRKRWQATWDGIEVTYLTAPWRLMISSLGHLPYTMRLLGTLHNPVVHVHGTGLFQAAVCALFRLRRIPFIWTLHGISEKETWQAYCENPTFRRRVRYWYYTLLERFKLRIAPDIFVDTPYVAQQIKPSGNLHVLLVGIFTEEFASLRASPRKAPVLLSLGVLDPRKGHHLALEALARVRKKVPDARLIVAGVSLMTTDYFESLKIRAKELGIEDAVEFAVGRPRSEIVAFLGQARVMVLHSQEESQGLAMCEALAAGLPVVATRVGGIPYVVTEGQDGFLVDYGDVPGFADAILRLLTDDALHTRMSQQAVVSSQRFEWNTLAQEVVKIYRKISKTSK